MPERLVVGIGVMIAVAMAAAAAAEPIRCPATPESLCAPGEISGRIFCEGSAGVVEYSSVSDFCLGCHDGSAAKGKDYCVGGTRWQDCGHPVEILYPTDPQEYQPLWGGSEAIKLTAGKVTCESCHAGSSPANHYLSVEITGSRLCLTCHRK